MMISLFFAGCAATAPTAPSPELDLPATWSRTGPATQANTAWLDDFKDPTLENLITEALAQNADLQVTVARFSQSLAEAGLSRADRGPSAGLGLNAARQKINSFGPQSIDSVNFNNYQLGLNISWEIDLWGKLKDRSSAANSETEASAADLLQAELSLAAQIAKSWFNFTESQAQWKLSRQTAASYRKNLKTLEARFQRGLSDGLDLHRIRTQAATAEAQVAVNRRRFDASARQLETLLGRYPSAAIEPDKTLPPLPADIPAGLPADLLKRRPDLIAAERRLAAAEKSFSASKKERFPSISLTGFGGTSSEAFENLLKSDFGIWSLAGNLAQPLYQSGRIRSGIKRTAALRDQARARYRATLLRALREVETTLAAETFLKKEYAKRRLASEQADAAETLAWERYRAGTTRFLDALESQRTAANARAQLISLRNLLLQNRIDLYLALGGPFRNPS